MSTDTHAKPVKRQRSRAEKQDKPQLPTPVRPQRRWGLIALGFALLAVSVLGVQMLLSRAAETVEVVALAQSVDRGDTLAQNDLVVVQIPAESTGLSTVTADQMDSILGQVAATDLLAGTTLAPVSTVDELLPSDGTSIVGFALTVGQLPSQPLSPGDSVRVVDTPVSQGEPPAGPPIEFDATVLTVQTDATTGTTLIDLEVAAEDASQVAVRAYTGRAVLVLDSPEN